MTLERRAPRSPATARSRRHRRGVPGRPKRGPRVRGQRHDRSERRASVVPIPIGRRGARRGHRLRRCVTRRNHCDARTWRDDAHATTASYPFTAERLTQAWTAAVGPRTRLAIVDHISADTAIVFPLADIASTLKRQGSPCWATARNAPASGSRWTSVARRGLVRRESPELGHGRRGAAACCGRRRSGRWASIRP